MTSDKPPREIKFRAWDREEKVMIDADSWYFSEEFEPFVDSVEKCQRRFDLMQFTGLTDKNGVEIYGGNTEGDIVDFRDGDLCGVGRVVWGESNACWYIELDEDRAIPLGSVEEREVIGNSLQHPHLLGREEEKK